MFTVYPHLTPDTETYFAKHNGEVLQAGMIGSVGVPSYNTGALAVNRQMSILGLTQVPVLLEEGLVDPTDYFAGLRVEKIFLESADGGTKVFTRDSIECSCEDLGRRHTYTLKFDADAEIRINVNVQTGELTIFATPNVLGVFLSIMRNNSNRR